MLAFDPFLTAYDPSDLPGGSVDPLGFERGYLTLADKILPGLTNVASRPRYFSALCAGVLLSDARSRSDESPQARKKRRLDAVLRLERFWTLACVLAARADSEIDTSGIRGIRYVETATRRLEERGDTNTDADFRLLSRQLTYGAVGIYGNVADGLRLIDRDMMTLGPDLGRRAAEAFVEETDMPKVLRDATANEGTVSLSTLAKWGARAQLDEALVGDGEARALGEALQANDVRRRMAALLGKYPGEGLSELQRLASIERELADSHEDPDLREALRAIVAYEECFRLALLAFFRLLWFCQAEEPFSIELARAAKDPVLSTVHAALPAAYARLDAAVAEGSTAAFLHSLDRLGDAKAFAQSAAASKTVAELCERVLLRHKDVQRSKMFGGRPKMPWIEVDKGRIVPTLSSAQRVGAPPKSVDSIASHPYRTGAADRLSRAGRLS
jgi:hypothetical protein